MGASYKKAKLVLENGLEFHGYSFGADTPISGEVVFNTSMTGYPESLTDPSYKGQILTLTYPLVGNYGVPGNLEQDKMLKYFESDRLHISALIISDYSDEYSHWNAHISLGEWLKQSNIPGITGIDTRELTKVLREKGTMLGKILIDGEADIEFYDPNEDNLVAQVSINEPVTYGEGSLRILLIDCGVKYNIIRNFLKRDVTLVRVPWNHDISKEEYDGLFISNGPGDPKMCRETIVNLTHAFTGDIPVFGICLGNQLMGLAAGADTYKLKYGHRSHNQPVIRKGTDNAYITSQNHGFAINNNTLPNNWQPLFLNLNDNTNEGIAHNTKPFFSSQFHPEASSGPTDTEFLFDEFLDKVREFKGIPA